MLFLILLTSVVLIYAVAIPFGVFVGRCIHVGMGEDNSELQSIAEEDFYAAPLTQRQP